MINTDYQLNDIFERIARDKNGVLVRVRFTIIDGKGHIVSIEPIAQENILLLPFTKKVRIVISNIVSFFTPVISPFTTLEFYMSQPTRAPSFL